MLFGLRSLMHVSKVLLLLLEKKELNYNFITISWIKTKTECHICMNNSVVNYVKFVCQDTSFLSSEIIENNNKRQNKDDVYSIDIIIIMLTNSWFRPIVH